MDIFYLDEYLQGAKVNCRISAKENNSLDFTKLCIEIRDALIREWEEGGAVDFSSATSLQKRAII
ncbi:MAG: hypothetical protein PHQ50_06015, partial [Eubacteriales bacterium]|nr:hypothetical protein [Eubacteriales bacterium]